MRKNRGTSASYGFKFNLLAESKHVLSSTAARLIIFSNNSNGETHLQRLTNELELRSNVILLLTLKHYMWRDGREGKVWNLVFEAKVEVGQHVQTW